MKIKPKKLDILSENPFAKDQLGHSLKCVYGNKMDTAGYLRRFIDYNYHLPIPRKGKYYKELFKRFNLAELLHKNYDPNQEPIDGICINLFEIFNFTLRDQEKCFTMLSICCKLIKYDYSFFLIFLIVLKLADEKLYIDYITQKM